MSDSEIKEVCGIPAHIYKIKDPWFGDSSINGLSSQHDRVVIIDEPGGWMVPGDRYEPVKLVRRVLSGRVYVHAEPVTAEKKQFAFGGTFISSCDSRFRAISDYPLPLHDRDMSKERTEAWS